MKEDNWISGAAQFLFKSINDNGMPKLTEYKDSREEHRIQLKADNGYITFASSQGYKNRMDAVQNAINSSIDILDHYAKELNQEQYERLKEIVKLNEAKQ